MPGRSTDGRWQLCCRKRGTDSWLLLLLPALGASPWSDLISLFRLIKKLLQPYLCRLGALSSCILTAEGQSHCFGGEFGGGTGGPFITPRGIGGWDTLQRVLFQAMPPEAEGDNPGYSTAKGHHALPCCDSAQKYSLGPGACHANRNPGNCCPPERNCGHVGVPEEVSSPRSSWGRVLLLLWLELCWARRSPVPVNQPPPWVKAGPRQ